MFLLTLRIKRAYYPLTAFALHWWYANEVPTLLLWRLLSHYTLHFRSQPSYVYFVHVLNKCSGLALKEAYGDSHLSWVELGTLLKTILCFDGKFSSQWTQWWPKFTVTPASELTRVLTASHERSSSHLWSNYEQVMSQWKALLCESRTH